MELVQDSLTNRARAVASLKKLFPAIAPHVAQLPAAQQRTFANLKEEFEGCTTDQSVVDALDLSAMGFTR